jgi:hypothetical protein
MWNFFVEGGWGMWPVTVFGLITVWAAGRYAHDLQPFRLRFTLVMAVVVIISAFNAVITGMEMVLWYVEDRARTPDEDFARTLVTGIKEASRAAPLAGVLLTLAAVLVAVGIYRAGRREMSKSKA